MDFISTLVDRVVDITGPYVAVAILTVVVILLIYRLMGR
jgi:hypothetical protein